MTPKVRSFVPKLLTSLVISDDSGARHTGGNALRKSLILTLTLVLLGFVAVEQPAAQLLNDASPTCFSTSPFSDVLVWFLNSDGGNQLDGSGRDLSGNRAQSVNGFVRGGILHVGYTTYPKPSFVPVIAGGTIDLSTGTGSGQCFAPAFANCGSFTFRKIACPSGAATSSNNSNEPATEVDGLGQGAER